MEARKITAIVIAAAALLATIALSVIPVKYMSEYGGMRPLSCVAMLIGGTAVAAIAYRLVMVTVDEARSLLSADTEVLIIGNGWDSAVTVDPKVKDLQGVRVEILSTPDAFKRYNECKSEGRNAVLIAHSSC